MRQETQFLQWSNTRNTAVSASNQGVFGTVTRQDDIESESISDMLTNTSSEQYLIANQELFHSDHSESEEEDEEEDEEDEADEINEEEEDMIEIEDLGKYFYDLI